MAQLSDDGVLSPSDQVALVIHQLRLRNALPEIPPLLSATWPFPSLNANDALWLERKRQESAVDWPWFRRAIEFLRGEGVPESSFERLAAVFLEQLDKEIGECNRISKTPSPEERRKLVGGLGGVSGNVNGSVESMWDKRDPSEWREQE